MAEWLTYDVCIVKAPDRETALRESLLLADMGVAAIVTADQETQPYFRKINAEDEMRHYPFPLSAYPDLLPYEAGQLLRLIRYESGFGRKLCFWFADPKTEQAFRHVLERPQDYRDPVLPEKLPQCRDCFSGGCDTEFVYHITDLAEAKHIFETGELLSAVKARNLPGETLMKEVRNTAGDPADYFRYVMFYWGNCPEGDLLVTARSIGTVPAADHPASAFHLGIRFYFRYSELQMLPGAVYDGYHPVKIKDSINLTDCLYQGIVPDGYRMELLEYIPAELESRIRFLEHSDCLTLYDWNRKVCEAVGGED